MQEVRKALMGHSSGEDINATYTHVELPTKREAIRKLEAWVATQTQSQRVAGANVLRITEAKLSHERKERRDTRNAEPVKARDLV